MIINLETKKFQRKIEIWKAVQKGANLNIMGSSLTLSLHGYFLGGGSAPHPLQRVCGQQTKV